MKAAHPDAAPSARSHPGETLRTAREQRGLDVADVARQLNLTAQSVRRIEAGEFSQLPGATFTRGYVRAYAKLLGLEPDRLVAEFDQFTGSQAEGSKVSNLQQIEAPVRPAQRLIKPLSVVFMLALGGLSFLWWQAQQPQPVAESPLAVIEHVEVEVADGSTEIHPLDEPEDQARALALSGQDSLLPAEAPVGEPGPVVEAAGSPASQGEGTPAVEPAAEPVAAAAAPAEAVPAAQTAATPSAAEPAAAAPAMAPGEALVELSFTASCWIRLTDANGKELLGGLRHSGEQLQAIGKAPLELHLGFARGAQLKVNGQPYDITPHLQGETARLKQLGL